MSGKILKALLLFAVLLVIVLLATNAIFEESGTLAKVEPSIASNNAVQDFGLARPAASSQSVAQKSIAQATSSKISVTQNSSPLGDEWRRIRACRLEESLKGKDISFVPSARCQTYDAANLISEERRAAYAAALTGDKQAQLAYLKYADDYGFTPERLLSGDAEAQEYARSAMKFLIEAAGSGDEEAIALAAGAYKMGYLTNRDLSKAYGYESLLVLMGSKNGSIQEIANLEKSMRPGEITSGKTLGKELFSKISREK